MITRRVEIVAYLPGGEKRRQKVTPQGARMGYTEEGVQTLLEQAAETLQKEYPKIEFKLVELGGGRFNFVAQEPEGGSKLWTP